MMMMSFGADDETSLTEIEIIALSTMIASIFNGGDLADIALVIIENVLFGIGETALSDDLIVGC